MVFCFSEFAETKVSPLWMSSLVMALQRLSRIAAQFPWESCQKGCPLLCSISIRRRWRLVHCHVARIPFFTIHLFVSMQLQMLISLRRWPKFKIFAWTVWHIFSCIILCLVNTEEWPTWMSWEGDSGAVFFFLINSLVHPEPDYSRSWPALLT